MLFSEFTFEDFLCWLALTDGSHVARGIGVLNIAAKPIAAVTPLIAASPSLRVRPIRTAVIVLASGPVPYKAFKGLIPAIGELHCVTLSF